MNQIEKAIQYIPKNQAEVNLIYFCPLNWGFVYLSIIQFNIRKMNSNIEKYSKLQWAPEQQTFLKQLKQDQNLKSWKYIASVINEKFPHKNRNGKQCRERYINYVRFNQQKPKILGWSEEGDIMLFDKFLQFGAKWVQISNQMPGRSQNCLKNRFYGALRKVIRKINKIEKEKKLKYKKSIKYDSLMRILSFKTVGDENSSEIELDPSKSQFVMTLRRDLIELAINQQQSILVDQVLSLIVRIHQFNCLSRTNSLQKKVKESSTSQQPEPIFIPKLQSNCHLTRSMTTQEIEVAKQNSQQQNFSSSAQMQESEPESFMQLINSINLKDYYRPKGLQQQMCEILNMKYIPGNFEFL